MQVYLNIYYHRGKGPGLYRLDNTAQILVYCLKYTDLV